MARSHKENSEYIKEDSLSNFTQVITIKERDGKSYKLYYNPKEKDCTKAYKRVD